MDSSSINSKKSIKKIILFIAIFFSIAGAGLSLYATQLTFKLTVSGIVDPSGCSFNDKISCDAVLSTSHAKLFGTPVSWWGFLFYVWSFFTLLFAVNYKTAFGKTCAEAVLFISTVSIIFTFFKIYQLISLSVFCPVCIGMYICNFSIFFLMLKFLEIPWTQSLSFFTNYFRSIFKKSEKDNLSHPIRFGIIFVWLFAMGFLAMEYYENTVVEPSMSKVRLIVNEHYRQKPVEININGAPVSGDPEAKIKLVEFSDFQCPSCKLLSSNLKSMMLEYKDDVSLHFLNYPLDKSINENVKVEMHKEAALAAAAGICANEQNTFWNFKNEIFENQTKINREFLIELAKSNGMAINEFEECLDSDRTRQRILDDIKIASGLGIIATPTLFINGKKLKYWNSPEVIRSIIEEEKKRVNE